MIRFSLLSLCLILTGITASADEFPPGIRSARLLPGWTDNDGNRISAFELQLEPGWKTYWRKPGDSGLPPEFDWQESTNLAAIALHWPAPEAIVSGDETTLGYHDLLVLPFTARPKDPASPVELAAAVEFGVCEKICVPAYLELQAPAPGETPTPEITHALEKMPRPSSVRPVCTTRNIDDGTQLSVLLPTAQIELAAMELQGRPDVWVSSAQLEPEAEGTRATADFVPPSGKPFDLDPSHLLITVISPDGATEIQGCTLQD